MKDVTKFYLGYTLIIIGVFLGHVPSIYGYILWYIFAFPGAFLMVDSLGVINFTKRKGGN